MQRKHTSLLAALALAGALTSTMALAQESSMPKVGDIAPDFSLKYFDGSDLKDVKLSDYRGKKNAVAFYVFAFTGG